MEDRVTVNFSLSQFAFLFDSFSDPPFYAKRTSCGQQVHQMDNGNVRAIRKLDGNNVLLT